MSEVQLGLDSGTDRGDGGDGCLGSRQVKDPRHTAAKDRSLRPVGRKTNPARNDDERTHRPSSTRSSAGISTATVNDITDPTEK